MIDKIGQDLLTIGNVKYGVYSPCQLKCQLDKISYTEPFKNKKIVSHTTKLLHAKNVFIYKN